MKFVIQRVTEASVTVEGREIGRIGRGFLVLVGIGQNDTRETADRYLEKLSKLRIFDDAEGKTNQSLKDVDGQLLLVSQFTLYADCKKGNRPSFFHAGAPDMAEELYLYMLEKAKDYVKVVEGGSFGADMKVSLLNDGPFTVIFDEDMFG